VFGVHTLSPVGGGDYGRVIKSSFVLFSPSKVNQLFWSHIPPIRKFHQNLSTTFFYPADKKTPGKTYSPSLSLSLHFNSHFPGEPGLAGIH